MVCKVNFHSYGVAVYLHIVIKGGGWWEWKICIMERIADSSVNSLLVWCLLVALILQLCRSMNQFVLQSEHRGADKSLARSGRKQANVSVRMAWISFGALQEKKKTWQLASWCCWNRTRPWHASELVSFLVGLRTYQHPGTWCPMQNYFYGRFSPIFFIPGQLVQRAYKETTKNSYVICSYFFLAVWNEPVIETRKVKVKLSLCAPSVIF